MKSASKRRASAKAASVAKRPKFASPATPPTALVAGYDSNFKERKVKKVTSAVSVAMRIVGVARRDKTQHTVAGKMPPKATMQYKVSPAMRVILEDIRSREHESISDSPERFEGWSTEPSDEEFEQTIRSRRSKFSEDPSWNE